jgi:hypothetical protein
LKDPVKTRAQFDRSDQINQISRAGSVSRPGYGLKRYKTASLYDVERSGCKPHPKGVKTAKLALFFDNMVTITNRITQEVVEPATLRLTKRPFGQPGGRNHFQRKNGGA